MSLFTRIKDRIAHEPAVLVGAAGTAVMTGYTVVTSTDWTWATLVPAVVGAAIRFLVVPASEVEEIEVDSPEELLELLAELNKETPDAP